MKITARQLKTADTLDNGQGVVRITMIKDSNGRDAVDVELINSAGYRHDVIYSANHIMVIDRAEVDGSDPLSRPYWWGIEAEHERREDQAVYSAKARRDPPF